LSITGNRAISSAMVAMLVGRAAGARAARKRPRRNRRGEEPFLGALLPPQRVLDAGDTQPVVFNGMDERLERGRLRVVIAAADERAVAAGFNRQHPATLPDTPRRSLSSRDSSLRMTPSYFNSSRSRSVTTRRDSVAGRFSSRDGTKTCACHDEWPRLRRSPP